MGFQTIVHLLNDQMHDMERCPHGFTYMLTHPPQDHNDAEHIRYHSYSIAKEHNEPFGGLTQITVMPTFHADNEMFYMAGGNSIDLCDKVTYGMRKGKKVAIIELPEWMQKDDRFIPRRGYMIPRY
jgi:hypothetical protein